jgi:hypothetical protein
MSEKQPYRFIHNNIEVKLKADKRGQLTPSLEVRELKAIERSMVNDTGELVSIFDNTNRESSHLFEGERISDTAFDAAIYLDKSARPVRKIVRGLWNEFSDGIEPQAFFLNIDKRPWLAEMGFVDGEDDINLEDIPANLVSIDRMDPAYLRHALTRIRALYVDSSALLSIEEQEDKNIDESEKDIEKVWSIPTRLDGKTVAIVDEVKSSGNTLRIALQLLRAAIPEANFEGVWWSDPGQVAWDIGTKNMQKAAKFVPAWYSADNLDGRGVGDINEYRSSISPSKAQRIGRQILSAPLFDTETGTTVGVGKLTKQVNQDIQTLVNRYKSGELVDYLPDLGLADTNPERFNHYLQHYYKTDTAEKALAIRKSRIKK